MIYNRSLRLWLPGDESCFWMCWSCVSEWCTVSLVAAAAPGSDQGIGPFSTTTGLINHITQHLASFVQRAEIFSCFVMFVLQSWTNSGTLFCPTCSEFWFPSKNRTSWAWSPSQPPRDETSCETSDLWVAQVSELDRQRPLHETAWLYLQPVSVIGF